MSSKLVHAWLPPKLPPEQSEPLLPVPIARVQMRRTTPTQSARRAKVGESSWVRVLPYKKRERTARVSAMVVRAILATPLSRTIRCVSTTAVIVQEPTAADSAAVPLTPALQSRTRGVRPSLFGSLIETTKPGITRHVVITAIVGFVVPAIEHARPLQQWVVLLGAVIVGTALSAGGANALNQYIERSRDIKMERTMGRPLPSGRVHPRSVLWLGSMSSALGVMLLLAFCGPAAAAVSLACLLSYIFWYTPLKTRSPWATHVGGIPGALPPLIGWAGAKPEMGWTALTESGGWVLVAIMFAWQLPHFLAIGWMYREDYARGGYKTLSVSDPDGKATARSSLIWTFWLLVSSVLPFWVLRPHLGLPYLAAAVVSGLLYAALVVRFARTPTRDAARRVFFASIVHMPLLFAWIVGETLLRAYLTRG